MDRQTREIIEDVANLVALQIVRPIEQRLTAIETEVRCDCSSRKSRIDTKWKLIGLGLAVPGWLAAALSILGRF